jgi:hypothetical protein
VTTESWIIPDWPAPANVRSGATTRIGGHSRGAYAGFNLGLRCGDDAEDVAANRALLQTSLALPEPPRWLRQVHSARVLRAETLQADTEEADASWTDQAGVVCAVQAADCLPVLFCDRGGSVVAAAHAGWRGLAAGVLEATVGAMPVAPQALMAWRGPAIGPQAFEVGPEVRDAFCAIDGAAASAFRVASPGKYVADLYELARQRLARAGVTAVFGGDFCTYRESSRFFSFRRDRATGRMAALIWRRLPGE